MSIQNHVYGVQGAFLIRIIAWFYENLSKEGRILRSPTWGRLSLDESIAKIMKFVSADNHSQYRFIIGTDSQVYKKQRVVFVSTIIVHRIGFGAICFYEKKVKIKKYSLRERMFTEVFLSLDLATRFLNAIKEHHCALYNAMDDLEIHVDVGEHGATRDLINAVTGMVKGCGFLCCTKPDACGASSVADRFAKISGPLTA